MVDPHEASPQSGNTGSNHRGDCLVGRIGPSRWARTDGDAQSAISSTALSCDGSLGTVVFCLSGLGAEDTVSVGVVRSMGTRVGWIVVDCPSH